MTVLRNLTKRSNVDELDRRWPLPVALALLGMLLVSCSSGREAARAPKLGGARHVGLVVFDDTNGDGRVSPDEAGLGGLKVQVSNPLDKSSVDYRTDKSGAVQFDIGALNQVDISVTALLPAPTGGTARVPVVFNRTGAPGEILRIPTQLRPLPCRALEKCRGLLMPDLVSLSDTPSFLSEDTRRSYPSPRMWSIDAETKPGSKLLRIATATSNVGDGPLLVIGTNKEGGEYRSTVQRLLTSTGSYFDIPAGTFAKSDSHSHVHLERFEQLTFDSGADVTADKISFCLTDVFPIKEDVPKSPIGIPTSLFDCGDEIQGINVNSADYYGPALPEQFLDISGVHPGPGTVTIESDPDNMLIESDKANNSVSFEIDLRNPPSDG